jgi:hypothetical protein
MNKIKTLLMAVVAISALSTNAFAGQFGVGVAGSLLAISADGKEADADGSADTSVRSATASDNAYTASVFAEYSLDNGFTVGVEHTPGTADVNSKRISRTDDSFESGQDGDRSANAEIENHFTYYAELPIHGGLYVKAGHATMDVNTTEKFTGTVNNTYKNTSVDGVLMGIGYRNSFGNNGFYKVEGSHTEYDTLKLTSTDTGDSRGDLANVITADLDVTKLTFAVGLNF